MSTDKTDARGPTALAALRRYIRPKAVVPRERCALCDAELADEHPHMIEPATRRLACACDACALLFSGRTDGRYKVIPRRVKLLADFRLPDATWVDLGIPIDLAFLVRSTPAAGVVAVYPGPAGPIESAVAPSAWEALVGENPTIADLEPDVEALLVNRVGGSREVYRVGIDQCYRLVGLIRTKWRGFSGGQEVWDEIGRAFAGLRERSR